MTNENNILDQPGESGSIPPVEESDQPGTGEGFERATPQNIHTPMEPTRAVQHNLTKGAAGGQ